MKRLRLAWVAVSLPASAVVAFSCSTGDAAGPSSGAVLGTRDPDGGTETSVDAAPCSQIPLPEGGPIRITGRVVVAGPDGGEGPGLPNTILIVEWGGHYIRYCDMSRASPYYLFGTVTDKDGKFDLEAREGVLGFHGFTDGYYYSRGSLGTYKTTDLTIRAEQLPASQRIPTLANVAFDKNDVASGTDVTLSATVATHDKNDPLSDEIVVVEPTSSWGVELDPPREGKPDNFADGVWKRTFAAPQKAGTYTYWVSATTAGCVTTNLATATLRVR